MRASLFITCYNDTLFPETGRAVVHLLDRLGVEDVGAYFPHRVTCHASCHGLRSLHVGDRPFRLLRKVRGLELVPLQNMDRCQQPPALATYVSGPSATAGIEMTRIKGVHGPRNLNVILVCDENLVQTGTK